MLLILNNLLAKPKSDKAITQQYARELIHEPEAYLKLNESNIGLILVTPQMTMSKFQKLILNMPTLQTKILINYIQPCI